MAGTKEWPNVQLIDFFVSGLTDLLDLSSHLCPPHNIVNQEFIVFVDERQIEKKGQYLEMKITRLLNAWSGD